jgi:hypothetical protein
MVDLVIWLVVGAAAGWIAGIVLKGGGFGPLGNIIVGINRGWRPLPVARYCICTWVDRRRRLRCNRCYHTAACCIVVQASLNARQLASASR